MSFNPSVAFEVQSGEESQLKGNEPTLGGKLREKAVWVDESICIGCRYCANVASNTFVIEEFLGRSRAFRQDGDSFELIQEAIETCPVDCIHWVPFEDLNALKEKLAELELQPLGMLPKAPKKRIKPGKI